MKNLLLLALTISLFTVNGARAADSICEQQAKKIVSTILKTGNLADTLPSDTLFNSAHSRDVNGNLFESVEFVWMKTLPTIISMRFLVEEEMCTLELNSLKVGKN